MLLQSKKFLLGGSAFLLLRSSLAQEGLDLNNVEFVYEREEIPGWPSPRSKDAMKNEIFRTMAEDFAATKILRCDCADFDKGSVRPYAEETPQKGDWKIDLPVSTCAGGPVAVGPYADRGNALQESKHVAERIEQCFNNLRHDDGPSVPRAEFDALTLELQLLQQKVHGLEHDLARCKTDHDLFVQNEDSQELQDRINEFLRHVQPDEDDAFLGDQHR